MFNSSPHHPNPLTPTRNRLANLYPGVQVNAPVLIDVVLTELYGAGTRVPVHHAIQYVICV